MRALGPEKSHSLRIKKKARKNYKALYRREGKPRISIRFLLFLLTLRLSGPQIFDSGGDRVGTKRKQVSSGFDSGYSF